MVQQFCILLRYLNITKLLKFKMFALKSKSGHRVLYRIYDNLGDTSIKYIFFSVCLFFLFTITGGNKAIIVELKKKLF